MKKIHEMLYRSMSFDREAINVQERTVSLAFSSETKEVERSFGIEVLDHRQGAVRMGRMKGGAPLLLSHDERDLVGVVQDASIDPDRRGRATVKFSRSPKAEEVFQDVQDGIRKHVSVGYKVHAMELERSQEGNPDLYRITDWEPLEISLVSVPADVSVGVGRSEHTVKGNHTMEHEDSFTEDGRTPRQWSPLEKEQNRSSEILALAERFNNPGGMAMASTAIRENWSVNRYRDLALNEFIKDPEPLALPAILGSDEYPDRFGMGLRDLKDFSLLRLLRGMAKSDFSECQFEVEVSRNLAKQLKRESRGALIPVEALMQRDILKSGTGGNLIATQLVGFVDFLRPRSLVARLGATILPGLRGDVDVPRHIGTSNVVWLPEGGTTVQSDATFDKISLSPKTVSSKSKISRKMLLQNSVSIENLVRSDLALSIGQEIDRVAINGSGASNQPTGILQTAGIGAVVGGTDGAAPTWTHIVQLESDVAVSNADTGALGYLTTPQARGKLKLTEKFSGTSGESAWSDRRDKDGFGSMNSYRAGATTQVPSNLTKGSGTDLSAIIYGNWADLVIGEWGVLDLQVDPYTSGDEGALIVRVFQDVDVAVRHPESFSAMVDAVTT